MATTVAELQAVITADTRDLDSGLARVTKSFDGLGASSISASSLISGAIGGLVAGAFPALIDAIGSIGTSIYQIGVTFDDASDRIRISTGAVGDELKGLEASFKTVFTSIPASAEDASQAISFLAARLQLSGEALEDLAKTELELARITGSQLAPQLEATTRVFKDWEIATNRQTESLDFLFKVGQKTAIGVTDLSQKLVQFGAPLRQLGFSFEQAAVLIGKFQAEGVDLGKTLPGLRQALSRLAKEGVEDASAAFSILTERIKNAKSPVEATRLAMELFGQRAGPDMAEAIKQGRFSIEELQASIESSRETILGAAKDTDDFAEAWTRLKNKTSVALESLGEVVFNGLNYVVTLFSGTEQEIQESWDQLFASLENVAKAFFNRILKMQQEGNDKFRKIFEEQQMAAGKFSQMAADEWKKHVLELNDPFKGLAQRNLELTAAMKKQQEETKKAGNALGEWGKQAKGGAGHARALTDALEETNRELRQQAKEAADAAGFFADLGLKELKELYEDLPLPIRKFTEAIKLSQQGITDQSEALQKSIAFGDDWMRFINEAKDRQASLARSAQNLADEYEDLSRSLPHAWNVIIEGFSKGITSTSVKIKGFASDLINVFDTMPGKWGDALRRTIDEVNRWVSFIDSAIKLVQRIMGDEQTGLAGVFSKIAGIFKKTTQDVKEATHDIGQGSEDWGGQLTGEMNKAAAGVSAGAGKILGSLSGLAAGVLAFAGVKGAGRVGGAVSGALGALSIAGGIAGLLGKSFSSLFTGPAAPFVIGGMAVAGILGAIFGGKSALQKAQEAAALQQAKDAIKISMQNVLKGAQEVIQSATESFMKALEFFDKLDEFTAVRKAKFQEFWKAMTRLMNGFFDLAKQFAGQSMGQLKEVAETLKPIAEAISMLPAAFDAISGHFGIAQSSIDRFFADFSKLMNAFFERSEVWIDGISKRAMKVANRLSPVVQLISAFGQALGDISGVKEPGDEIFAIFSRVIDKIVDAVAGLSLKFDKAVLKTMANFAEKAGAALGIWKEAIESIKATVDIQAPSEASVDNVVQGIELFINKLAGAVERMVTTDLARITAFANVVTPIAAAIKAWAETAEVIRGYTAVAADVWDQIVTDFERGLTLLNLLILDAQVYVDKATLFKALIDQGASLVEAALGAFGASISSAASALTGGLPQGGTATSAPVSSQGLSGSAIQSRAAATVINVTVQGTVIESMKLADAIKGVLVTEGRRSNISLGVVTG